MKRPILYIVIPFCLGIVVSRFFYIPLAYTVILSAAFLALTILKSNKNTLSHILLYLAVFFFGMAAYQNSVQLPADHIAHFVRDAPQKVIVKGVVVDDPVTGPALYGKKKTGFTLRVNGIAKIGTVPAAMASTTWGTVPIFPQDDDHNTWQGASGLVKVSAYSDKEMPVSFGDELILEGLLSKPQGLKNPGLFDYSSYLKIKNIYAVFSVNGSDSIREFRDSPRQYGCDGLGTVLKPIREKLNLFSTNLQRRAYVIRHKIRDAIMRYINNPYNGFLKAILIGDRRELENSVTDDFVKTGTVHILAISGLHVGLMAGIIMALFALLRVPKKVNFILSALVLIFYSFVAGSSPPIIRAVIIFCVFVIGHLINRDADIMNSLAFAAFLILLWNPGELFDPSFQLSFASVASIIVFTPKIDAMFRLDSIRRSSAAGKSRLYVLKGISVSIAAWLGTWPFVAAYFNIISPAAILANLIVIPMLFLLMALSFIFLSASVFSSFFAKLLAYILCMAGKSLFWLNHGLASLPFSYFRIGSPSTAFAILYYAFIFVLFLPDAFRLGRRKVNKTKIIAVLLIFFNVLVWRDILAASNRRDLRVTFLDVGHGDSIFMEFPGPTNVLIDGGSGGEGDTFDAGRLVVAPYLWNRGVSNIDAVIVTHFHEDHVGGMLYILKNFRVGSVIDSGAALPENKIYGDYLETIRKKGVRRITVGEGDGIGPFGELKFFVLNPEKREDVLVPSTKRNENDNSIVLKVIYKNFSALFCGDITDETMKYLTEKYGKFLKSDIIKVPHHGGRFKDESIVRIFFQAVSPKISIISVGRTNRDEVSSQQVSKIITYLNSESYDTETYGAVTVYSDGNIFGINTPIVKKN